MRRTERVAVELPVTWLRAGQAVQCTALDINAHGMFLSTHYVVDHDSLMRIEVLLPDGELSLFVTARYVGRTMRGQGIGVEIFLADEVSRGRWMRYYEAALAREAHASVLAIANTTECQASVD